MRTSFERASLFYLFGIVVNLPIEPGLHYLCVYIQY